MTQQRQDFAKWAAVMLTLGLTLIGFAVQAGIVVATVRGLQSSVNDLVNEVRSTRAEYSALNTRVAVIESQKRISKD